MIRDGDSRPVNVAAYSAETTAIPVAEALALRNGLVVGLVAKQKGLKRLEVEGDSKLVIDSVNGVSTPPWRLRKTIADI